MPKLLLLDGHSLAYRAFFALPQDLATAAGTVTNAVYGFTSMLTKVIADERPDLIGVAFDTPGPTFRDEMDAEYKAGRAETPELFKHQVPLIREVLDTLQIRRIEHEGVEADDVIATLATLARDAGIDVVVVTGDRDSFQLVEDPHIRVLYNKRGVSDYALYDEAGIVERTGGVSPARYVQYAALRGDPSDNLPGVPGIGEKTAAKLVSAYGDLEGIYEHLDELPPKQRQNLGEARDRVFKNREMSTLRRDVDVGLGPTDLAQGPFDREALRVLCNQLEFRTLLPRILAAVGDAAQATASESIAVDVTRARDADEACAAVAALLRAGVERVAIEGRWAGAPGRSDLLGLAIADDSGRALYFDGVLVREASVRAALGELLADGGPRLVAHRAKELIHGLGDPELCTLAADTALMAYLLDPGEGKYLLDDLALRYLSVELVSPDAGEGQLDFGGDAGVEVTGRAAVAMLALANALEAELASRELTDLYERFERPLVPVLARMESVGIRVDVAFLRDLGRDLAEQCRAHEARIHALAGEPFLVNSVPQLRTVLFDKLGLTPVKKTKTGPSTDADSLGKMLDQHPIVEELLRYREVEKLRSTYTDALPPLVREDGRIHATFNQLVAATGRISSESPNLQNIPVRSASGREMRRAFVADDGCGLLTADYSQIELRVLAHVAEDEALIEAFARGDDIHTVTAARVFEVAATDVDEHQRRFAKVVNYGLAYGMEAYGLGQRAGIPTEQAKEILDAYWASFPGVAAYMRETVREARNRGYTTTIFGRRRQLPELTSDNFRVRQMGERMAQNAPVQGSAADIFKLAMIHVDDALAQTRLRTRMVLTVHDELVFEVPLEERAEAEALVTQAMETVCELRVPLVVGTGFGLTWAEAQHD